MKIDIFSLFPESFSSPFDSSILKRAQAADLLSIRCHNLRDWAFNKHRIVDDRPFGGGPGMVLKPEPFFEALESFAFPPETPIILTSPRAPLFQQADAIELSQCSQLVFLCGHYESIDERVREHVANRVYSIGSYVLTGGELPVMVMVDAIARLIPGVVGCHDSVTQDSFMDGLLDCPHYTRPAEYRGHHVPEVLLSGNHSKIEQWRQAQKLQETQKYRPDLLTQKEHSHD